MTPFVMLSIRPESQNKVNTKYMLMDELYWFKINRKPLPKLPERQSYSIGNTLGENRFDYESEATNSTAGEYFDCMDTTECGSFLEKRGNRNLLYDVSLNSGLEYHKKEKGQLKSKLHLDLLEKDPSNISFEDLSVEIIGSSTQRTSGKNKIALSDTKQNCCSNTDDVAHFDNNSCIDDFGDNNTEFKNKESCNEDAHRSFFSSDDSFSSRHDSFSFVSSRVINEDDMNLSRSLSKREWILNLLEGLNSFRIFKIYRDCTDEASLKEKAVKNERMSCSGNESYIDKRMDTFYQKSKSPFSKRPTSVDVEDSVSMNNGSQELEKWQPEGRRLFNRSISSLRGFSTRKVRGSLKQLFASKATARHDSDEKLEETKRVNGDNCMDANMLSAENQVIVDKIKKYGSIGRKKLKYEVERCISSGDIFVTKRANGAQVVAIDISKAKSIRL